MTPKSSSSSPYTPTAATPTASSPNANANGNGNGNGTESGTKVSPTIGTTPVAAAASTANAGSSTVLTPAASNLATSGTSASSTIAAQTASSTTPAITTPAQPTMPGAKRVSFPPPARTPTVGGFAGAFFVFFVSNSFCFVCSTPTTPSTPGFGSTSTPTTSSFGGDVPSSSRPAPPSPALSRRSSAVPGSLVRSSSSASSRGSGAAGSRRASRVLGEGHAHSGSQSYTHGHGSPSQSRRASGIVEGQGHAHTGSHGGQAHSPSQTRRAHRLSRSVSAADAEEAVDVDEEDEASSSSASRFGGAEAATTSKAASTASSLAKLIGVPAASSSAERGPTLPTPPPRAMITVRDFAFPAADERHAGLGPDVPAACDPRRLARRLKGVSHDSDYGLPKQEHAEEDEDGMDGFLWGRGRMSWAGLLGGVATGGGAGGGGVQGEGGPSGADFARNFGEVEFGEEEEEEEGEEEDALYYAEAVDDVPPGLYRAQFAFQALDAAEMDLAEGQLVHVLGSGAAGAGWAITFHHEPPLVLDSLGVLEVNTLVGSRTDAGTVWGEMWVRAAKEAQQQAGAAAAAEPEPQITGSERRALVPDSYLVMVRGEGEREADAHERLVAYIEWVERERIRQEAEAAEEAKLAEEGEGGNADEESPQSSEYEDAVEGGEQAEGKR
ncbi:hypothetical protein C8R43DRAFT_484841 [Mycena crocata]|nr:hypothetical protein C8R43DRAFT_484841 [Mycena crocata]